MSAKLIVLVVEDNPNDTVLLERAFVKNRIQLPIHVCRDGLEAMDYLKGKGRYADRETFPFPRVIIMDLRLPKCTGFDLLAWLQAHPECNLIPKIVLSISDQIEDVTRAYQLGANCYFRKTGSLDELSELVRTANDFWLKAVIPPLPEKC